VANPYHASANAPRRKRNGTRGAIVRCNEAGQAIFSGTRTAAAIDNIRRIADAQNWTDEQRAPLAAASDQLGEITRIRNDILHYGTRITGLEGERYATNAFVAHTKERIRETRP
jgi:hypothetical protein